MSAKLSQKHHRLSSSCCADRGCDWDARAVVALVFFEPSVASFILSKHSTTAMSPAQTFFDVMDVGKSRANPTSDLNVQFSMRAAVRPT